MGLPVGLPRLAVGLAVIPFAALIAAACGGSDIVDASDASASSDAARDSTSSEAATGDGASSDARSDAPLGDAGAGDADAALRDAGAADADAALRDADAGLPDADAGLPDADASFDAEAGLDAEAGRDGGDAGQSLLGSSKNFAVLAGSTITITPTAGTTIFGDVGVSPGTAIVTLPSGQPVGTVYAGGPVAAQAESDLTTAYNTLAGMACGTNLTATDLGGKTLAPGVYCFNTSAGITGDLVLDAQLNPNAVWVIQIGSTLTTGTISSVTVINGGSACNVYWQVGSSATLGTGTKFLGNIVALTSISLVTSASILTGRALARNGAVALDSNQISIAGCP